MKIAALIATVFAALTAHSTAQQCAPGQVSVSVEGGQNGCAWPPICVANNRGNCPANSYCDTVKTGVLGCKTYGGGSTSTSGGSGNPVSSSSCPPGQLPVSVEGRGTSCAYGPICAGVQGNCPDGSECTYVRSGVLGCKPKWGASNFAGLPGSSDSSISQDQQRLRGNIAVNQVNWCPQGQQLVSVEGGQNGCAYGPICVANQPGNCPWGSYCGTVATGVLGCKKF